MPPTSHNEYTADRGMSRMEAWLELNRALSRMSAAAKAKDGNIPVLPFESIINNSDAIRLHGMGVVL